MALSDSKVMEIMKAIGRVDQFDSFIGRKHMPLAAGLQDMPEKFFLEVQLILWPKEPIHVPGLKPACH